MVKKMEKEKNINSYDTDEKQNHFIEFTFEGEYLNGKKKWKR